MAITPLTDADRVAHAPVGPEPYEWWYFEVHAKVNGVDWIVVLSAHSPHAMDPVRMLDVHLERGTFRPDQFSGVDVSVYRIADPGRRPGLVALGVTRTAGATLSATAPLTARFGADVLTIDESTSGPRTYTLALRQKGALFREEGIIHPFTGVPGVEKIDLELDVTFQERAVGFKLGDGTILTDPRGGRHAWAIVMPDARVDGQLRLGDGDPVPLSGAVGYHDKQWGPDLPMRAYKEWSWGRTVVPKTGGADVLLFFQTCSNRGPGHPSVVSEFAAFVPAGGAAEELTGRVEPERWTDGPWQRSYRRGLLRHLLRLFGTTILRLLDRLLRARPSLRKLLGYWTRIHVHGAAPTGPGGASEDWSLEVDQKGTSVEPWPFYNRYLPQATLTRDGTTSTPEFVLTEFAQPAELSSAATLFGMPLLLGGIAVFSELVTEIEPGAPRLSEL